MALDNTMKESNKKKWSHKQDKGSLKNGTKYQKNGDVYTTAYGNDCSEKETMFKNDMIECSEEQIKCGLGPCSPKWLQVMSDFI